MYWIFFAIISATIPEGWPMLRGNQQRTGYVPGHSCFDDTCLVKWQLLIENSEGAIIFNGPVAADFNTDGQKDILVGIYTFYPAADLYNGPNGGVLWQAAYTEGGPKYGSPALMEVTGDNRPEVFLHTGYFSSPAFRCLNGTNGSGVWQNSNVYYGDYSGPLVIEGTPGAVVVGSDNGTLWSLDATNGNPNWSYPVANYIQPPSFGDVDGDGSPEIVVVGGRTLYVFETGGGAPWNIDTGDSATTPALANMDSDPELEIVIYNYLTGRVKGYNCGNPTPFMDVSIGPWTPQYDPDPTVQESWPCSPGLADITEDGVIDIVIHNGVTLYCINGATHSIEWNYPGTHFFGSPVISNLDNDPHLEIVVTGKPDPGGARLKIEVVEHTGALKFRWWSPVSGSGFPDPSLNEACLADVDNDGYLEISAADYSCWLVVLDCEASGVEEDTKSQKDVSILTTVFNNEIELILPSVKWVEYTMYDVCGRAVYEGRKSGIEGRIRLDVSKVGTGVYFLKIKTPDEEQTFKVVKLL